MTRRLIIVLVLLLGTAGADYALSRPEMEQSRQPLSELPKKMGDWELTGEHAIDEGSMAVLQVDDYIMRTYRNGKGETVGLYVGYFKTQREGKQVHSPRQCLPGAGWTIMESKQIHVPMESSVAREIPVNAYVMAKGNDRDLYLWWYQGRGRVYTNEYLNKLYLVWDSITKSRTDGALVRVNTDMRSDSVETLRGLIAFTGLFFPTLDSHIPR